MAMVPCSFDQKQSYQVPLKAEKGNGEVLRINEEAWNREPFDRFRAILWTACPNCITRTYCMSNFLLISVLGRIQFIKDSSESSAEKLRKMISVKLGTRIELNSHFLAQMLTAPRD